METPLSQKNRMLELYVGDLTGNLPHTCKIALCKQVTMAEQTEVSTATEYSVVADVLEVGIKRLVVAEKTLGSLEVLDNKIVVKNGVDLVQFATFEEISENVMGYVIYIEETNKVIGYKFHEVMYANMNNITIQLPYNIVPHLVELV